MRVRTAEIDIKGVEFLVVYSTTRHYPGTLETPEEPAGVDISGIFLNEHSGARVDLMDVLCPKTVEAIETKLMGG